MIFTHMELGDVKVGLDGTQFPRLIFQKHPQLFQSCPEGLKETKGGGDEYKKRTRRVKKLKRTSLSICDLLPFRTFKLLLCSESPDEMCCKGH